MITLNGNEYKLCLIDTNVVSEIIKHPNTIGRRYFEALNPGIYIPCFSLFTILELRQTKKVYNSFLEIFSIIPCIILKSLDQLFQDELDNYPDSDKVSPILVSCPGVLAPKGLKLGEILELAFSKPELRQAECKWSSGKIEILDGMLSLVKNYPPKGDKYTQNEIRIFVEIAGYQQIVLRANNFARCMADKKCQVLVGSFPSIKTTTFTVFYKFYMDQRRPLESDPFDIIISSALPYVDAVVTEKHLAYILMKVKNQDDFLNHLEIYRLKDLQVKGG
jgi:hypothetical protein